MIRSRGSRTRRILVKREVVEALLVAARNVHPKEVLLLLRGRKLKDGALLLEEIIVPPLAIYGYSFSGFNPYLLPLDLSILGVAHSHPSGNPRPSVQDLNVGRGRVMVIIASPYASDKDVHVYLPSGEEVGYEVC
ncbi:MAG: peptidase [Thermoprotei archaeon]|nr:MAG: peptidase [Thermoprotei archaeon]RLF15339.1 MAG: peptidase [Thermoprotei archaeon]